MNTNPNAPCPCFSGRPFRSCCSPWLKGKPAPSPEALMRSRFAAYALGNAGYITRTTHPQSPHAQPKQKAWRQELKAFCRQTDFLGLQILQVGEIQGDVGWVTFRAILMQAGRDVSFTEKSRFERVNGRWFYHSAN
ncbi:MAG: zinc chelation protein SecC [Aquificales bacterium]|nr:zinc chelation protein SecC [Aquificales bacterium]